MWLVVCKKLDSIHKIYLAFICVFDVKLIHSIVWMFRKNIICMVLNSITIVCKFVTNNHSLVYTLTVYMIRHFVAFDTHMQMFVVQY